MPSLVHGATTDRDACRGGHSEDLTSSAGGVGSSGAKYPKTWHGDGDGGSGGRGAWGGMHLVGRRTVWKWLSQYFPVGMSSLLSGLAGS